MDMGIALFFQAIASVLDASIPIAGRRRIQGAPSMSWFVVRWMISSKLLPIAVIGSP